MWHLNPTRLAASLATLSLLWCPVFAADAGYRSPPQVLADIVEAPPTPTVRLSPDSEWMLLTETPNLIDLADLAQPELRLAGIRINPATNGRSRQRLVRKLTLMRRDTQERRKVEGLPDDARIGHIEWSPNSRRVAFTVTGDESIAPWLLDVASARARPLGTVALNAVGGEPLRWMPDSGALLCSAAVDDRGMAPRAPTIPAGPIVQENAGKVAPARTYQDLLQSPRDEALFEHYMAARLVRIALDGTTTEIGPAGLIWDFAPSPDGRFIHVATLHRPFSYLVPAYRFPRTIEIWHRDGRRFHQVADLPLMDQVPTAFGSVPTGPRSVQWRDDRPATLVWVEARDGGDARTEAEVRDELLALEAPFDGDPVRLAQLGYRFAGVEWGDDDLALVSERWWRNRRTRTWAIAPGRPDRAPRLLVDRSYQDRYGDPGRPVTAPTEYGGRVLLTADKGRLLFLIGEGASPEGNRPFFDRLDLKTGETERLWRSEAPYYEQPVQPLDVKRGLLLTRRESRDDPPNYFVRDLRDGKLEQITDFPHPTPQLIGVRKELIKYEREDGLQLTGTLYTPPGHDPTEGRLPLLLWAYPREFKSASDAAQVTSSPHRFDRIGWWSPLIFLARGYAVLDNPTMPIIGEGDEEPNDTYVEQLAGSAAAAIDAVVERGIADRRRVAIGGHSYGAFMAANLLAHSDLFAAGIARSGAYNRTLTPFGFQAEERTVWEAPEVYFTMSPFMHAEKIDEPILLIHGDADNNSGTFPMQSRRFYHALKGLGATARLVMLPHESHGYRARESVLHMLWEQDRWLELYVRKPNIESPAAVGGASD